MQKTENKKGFTLIELLVVISIIGLLSSVVLASLNSARSKAADAKILAERAEAVKALEIYYLANGGYPNPDYVSGGGPTKTRSFYCVGGTDCLLAGQLVATKLPNIGIGTIATDKISTSDGYSKGIVYVSCQENLPTCPIASLNSTSAQIMSATKSKGMAEQLVGQWTVLQYTPIPVPGT